jgi:hypothetical protein
MGTLGIGMTLFFLAWLVLMFVHAHWQGVKPQKRVIPLLVPLIFSALMIALRADMSLGILNIMTFLAAGLLFVYYFSGGNLFAASLWRYIGVYIESGVEVLFRPLIEGIGSLSWIAKRRRQWQKLMPVVRGLAITAPIVAVFVVLFGSADAVFGQYLRQIMNIFNIFDFRVLDALAFRAGYAGVIGWLAIGTLAVSLVNRTEKRKRPPTPTAASDAETDSADEAEIPPELPVDAPLFRIGLIETSMVLGGVCGVFLLFVLVQGVYLFGGVNNIANFNYAEYARRGFAELVAIAVLSLGLIYMLKLVTSAAETHEHKLFRGLGALLMVLTGIVLVSAFQRLRLYELTYGFTSLRLTIYITIVWLGVLLVSMAVSLYWSPRTVKLFETSVLVAMFGFSITHSLINPDWFVAWQNINRGDIDPVYLSQLSAEAAPVLLPLLDSPEPGVRAIAAQRLDRLRTQVRTKLEDWRSLTLQDLFLRSEFYNRELNYKIDAILKEEVPHLLDRERIEANLKLGMSMREVTRQFGAPAMAYANDYSRLDEESRDYNLSYRLESGKYLTLNFDTTLGLTTIQVCDWERNCDPYQS